MLQTELLAYQATQLDTATSNLAATIKWTKESIATAKKQVVNTAVSGKPHELFSSYKGLNTLVQIEKIMLNDFKCLSGMTYNSYLKSLEPKV
jgi:hypothetical protein